MCQGTGTGCGAYDMEKSSPQLAQSGFGINKRAGMGKQAETRATAEYAVLLSEISRKLTDCKDISMHESYFIDLS
jgi:hypothetical protein